MRRFDTVLFDLDGTLLDTLDDLFDSVNHILAENHLPLRTRAEVRRFLGNGSRRLVEQALPGQVEDARFDQLFNAYKLWYNDHCTDRTRPYPGTEALLSALAQADIATAIVSNKHAAATEALNARFFHAGVAVGQRDELPPKPAPDLAYLALERLGRGRERAVYVGDSEVDFQTAQNAGLPCILVSWGFRDRAELERLQPLHLVDTQAELLDLLLEA